MSDTVTIPRTLAQKCLKALAHAACWNERRESAPESKGLFDAHPELKHSVWMNESFDELCEAMNPE